MDTADTSSFGQMLMRRRVAAGLTQEALAERAHVSVRAISDLERGVKRTPYRHTVELLADALELDRAERASFHAAVQRRGRLPSASTPLAGRSRSRATLPLTPLIGREREEEHVIRLLRSEGVRLLTLTGTGGVGKTRLALQVAAHLQDDFLDGVVVVPLAAVRDPQLVLSTVAAALGIQESAERPDIVRLTEQLREKTVLLVLDNVEQVVAAAPQLAELLMACPGLKFLVTSRTRLRVRGEQQVEVPPLAVPAPALIASAGDLRHYPAVELFLYYAQSVRPGFQIRNDELAVLAELCRRLDGLPLAIELAAARTAVLSLPALLARTGRRLQLLTDGPRDLPARQQTMRNTIIWSYELLSPAEQRLFGRLAVCVGGCDADAAETICNADADLPMNVLDTLSSLVEKHLLIAQEQPDGEPRFRMLETIREYAGERLEASGEAEAIRHQHATYFLTLAEEGEAQLRGPERARWRTILEREHDNLRAALGWSVTSGETALGLRLAGALAPFWYAHGYANEGRSWFGLLLPAAVDVPSSVRAKALLGAGGWIAADNKRGVALLEESLSLYRELGDDQGIVPALALLALRQLNGGDFAQAAVFGEEALTRARALESGSYLGWVLSTLGAVAIHERRLEKAEKLVEEGLALAQKVGDVRYVARTLSQLAIIASLRSEFGRAAELGAEALAQYRELGDTEGVAFALFTVAQAALGTEDFERARSCAEESLLRWRRSGNMGSSGLWSLELLAAVAAAQGQPLRAARLWGAGEAFRDAANEPLSQAARPRQGEYQALARAQTEEEAWRAAWQEGRRMTLDGAVAYALGEPAAG